MFASSFMRASLVNQTSVDIYTEVSNLIMKCTGEVVKCRLYGRQC